MRVRDETAETPCETGAWSREEGRQPCTGCWPTERRARPPYQASLEPPRSIKSRRRSPLPPVGLDAKQAARLVVAAYRRVQ